MKNRFGRMRTEWFLQDMDFNAYLDPNGLSKNRSVNDSNSLKKVG